MNFVSIAFLIFILLVLVIYYSIPKKWQWIVLLVSSFVFYAWANVAYLAVLIFSIISIYLAAFAMGKINEKELVQIVDKEKEEKKAIKNKNAKIKKLYCFIAMLINILLLVVFKYLNPAISFINETFASNIKALNLVLPLGISFYTFQSIGYLIDVYRGVVQPQKNIFKYALFVSYFPQILQGPIGRYSDLENQLFEKHSLDINNIYTGFQRVVIGFFKKIAIADMLSLVVTPIYNDPTLAKGIIGIAGAVLYALQLYADFSGFMDITIGCSKMLGINLVENFNKPYLSKSISEYWRRWHITLGAWFRDYVYYPLFRTKIMSKLMKGKHRKITSKIATVVSLLITWLLIGLWHGANWTYICHGLYYGIIISLGVLLEPINSKIRDKFNLANKKWFSLIQIARTFIIVCFGYILFNSSSLYSFAQYVQTMFTQSGINALINNENEIIETLNLSWVYVVVLASSLVLWAQASHYNNKIFALNNINTISPSWRLKYVMISTLLIIITICASVYLSSLGIEIGGFIYYEF